MSRLVKIEILTLMLVKLKEETSPLIWKLTSWILSGERLAQYSSKEMRLVLLVKEIGSNQMAEKIFSVESVMAKGS
jgi:hypothetical protein